MSSQNQHSQLSADRWFALPVYQQLLMISNELNRAGNWIKKKDSHIVHSCYERALELTQLTIDDQRWRGNLKELCRFNELMAQLFVEQWYDYDFNLTLQKTLIALNPIAFNMLYGGKTDD